MIKDPTSTKLRRAIKLPITNDLFSKHFTASKPAKMRNELIINGNGK
jgi:hypothetical protein